MVRRILVSDEMAASLSGIDNDATRAIGMLNSTHVFMGAALARTGKLPAGFDELVAKVNPKDLEKFMTLAETIITDMVNSEVVEVREG